MQEITDIPLAQSHNSNEERAERSILFLIFSLKTGERIQIKKGHPKYEVKKFIDSLIKAIVSQDENRWILIDEIDEASFIPPKPAQTDKTYERKILIRSSDISSLSVYE